jgi:prepilin-type N-terminal cleavage/methylation domain-containing protein
MKARGFTLIELMIVIAIIAIIAAIAIPGLLSSQRASNERNASTSLKTLASAEADFRSNDRDGNHVNDFWTANVAGLYTMTNSAIPSAVANDTTDPSIKLIELSVASADADSVLPSAGGENLDLTNFAVFSPKAGYWYASLVTDNNVAGTSEATYRQDTGGTPTMGSVHNYWKFGFLAFPDSQAAGKYVFIIGSSGSWPSRIRRRRESTSSSSTRTTRSSAVPRRGPSSLPPRALPALRRRPTMRIRTAPI